ncbi:MARVEL domain-containing protein 3 [Trichomycterus rosablanca]|uniref:MARVEL domain-containing protein 3 n=1 Tax=Trichomycterus rosablanca TaxID=2290929 RepID=UPI002F35FDDE
MSEVTRGHRGQRERERERNGGGQRERTGGGQRDHRSSSRPQYSARESSSHSQRARRVPSEEAHESKCTHVCSRRGIVLICTVLTNLLVLFCIVAAYVTLSGMSVANFGGGSFIDVNIPFEGTELQQVRELDMQFGQMRAPGVYGGVAFTLTFGIISLLFVVSSSKPPYLLSPRLLIGQFAFQLIGAVAYVVAVGLYLHFVIKVNSTDVCLKRERLYARNGQTWMNCNVNGADAAVALFGIITTLLYGVGSFLTFRTIQNVKRYNEERVRYEAERPSRSRRAQSSPRPPDIYI